MNCTVDYSVMGPVVDTCGPPAWLVGGIIFAVIWIAVVAFFVISRADKKASDDHVETPGGHFISKEYLKDVERLRRKAREEVDREDGMQTHHPPVAPASDSTLPDDLTEREAALVQKFVAELRREQGVAAMDESHAESLPGSAARKPSVRRNPRSFQDWQTASQSTRTAREHRTVQ